MTTRFQQFIQLIYLHEGGYVNHPKDPGGETYRGISRRAHPHASIWAKIDTYKNKVGNLRDHNNIVKLNNLLASDSEITQAIDNIYYQNYWRAVHAEELPYPIGEYVCDFGINAGIIRAVHLLQSCLGVKTDGVVGPSTLEAARKADIKQIMRCLYVERVSYYLTITLNNPNQFSVMFLGWIRRTDDMYKRLMKNAK